MLLIMKNEKIKKYGGKSMLKQNRRTWIINLITKMATVLAYPIKRVVKISGLKYFNSYLVLKTRRNNYKVYLFEQKAEE